MTRNGNISMRSATRTARSVSALMATLLCSGIAFSEIAFSGVAFAAAVNTVDVATLSTATGDFMRLYGSVGNGSQGVPVAGGFDCNGDGKVDFGMAAFTASPLGRSGAGEIYLVFGDGSITGALDTSVAQSQILRIAGDQTGETAGAEIWIDDVTGDNIGDLLIGRQNYTPDAGRLGAGALTIIGGGSALSVHAATLAYLDLRTPPAGVTITTIEGAEQYDRLGIWMRTGDVTGDGVADIVVGADQEMQSGEKHAGAAYVIRGGSHLAVNQTADLATFGTATPDLEGDIAKIIPPEDSAHYHFGSTCQIGDLDEDHVAEVMVGAGLNRAGAAIRPPGGASGETHATGGSSHGTLYIAWADNFTGDPWATNFTFDISASPGSHSIIHGGANNVAFGEEILGGLDYDSDGNADLFVGDLVADVGSAFNAGTGHVLYNAAALKNEEFDIDAPLPTGSVLTNFLGAGSGDIAGDTALHGDFDGDGIGDLAFSSPHGDPLTRSNAGIIHVIYGQHGVWPASVDVDSSSLPSAGVRATEIYGANGAASGDQGDTLAYSAAAGDIDGDGRIDIITNEMVGNGIAPGTIDVGNLILLSGTLLDSTFLRTPTPTPLPCAGDCDGDGTTTVDELVSAVHIALGTTSLTECRLVDADQDDRVAIAELIEAVNGALRGCKWSSG